jgi:hypothetical protein
MKIEWDYYMLFMFYLSFGSIGLGVVFLFLIFKMKCISSGTLHNALCKFMQFIDCSYAVFFLPFHFYSLQMCANSSLALFHECKIFVLILNVWASFSVHMFLYNVSYLFLVFHSKYCCMVGCAVYFSSMK